MSIQWTPETWQFAYRAEIRNVDRPDHGEVVTYGRRYWQTFYDPEFDKDALERFDQRCSLLPSAIAKNETGLVVGCAFGYLIESMMLKNGFSDVWGCDSSDWIFDNILIEQPFGPIRDRIKKIDVRDPSLEDFWKEFIGGNGQFSWVITEEVLSSYKDDEVPAILDACGLAVKGGQFSNIVHVVGTDAVPFNTRTPEEWKTIRPSHTWVEASTGRII